MMWDFDTVYGKAKLYFARGAEHEHSDDEEFVIWHLLGFEFLLRAPLAMLHASLLAVPEGDSILAANGIPTLTEPKSVPTHTVVRRLMQIVPDFTQERERDAFNLLNLRNAELHTGKSAVGNVGNEFWLPKLLRVAGVICAYLEVDLADVLDEEVVGLGRSLVDREDERLARRVAGLIKEAKSFRSKLSEGEIASRALGLAGLPGQRRVACPACNHRVPIRAERMRTSRSRFKDSSLVRDAVYVATGFECPICTLRLSSTAEIKAAELTQQFTEEEREDLTERLLQDVVDYDYGND